MTALPITMTLAGTIMTDDSSRRAIKVWMREVLQSKDWSASEWARRAGTSSTNITRFLSPTSQIVPSSATISKLARVAGSQPKLNPLESLHVARAWQIPCIGAHMLSGFAPSQLWEYIMDRGAVLQTISIDGPIDGPAFVADVPATGMSGRGIQPGDRILVERIKRADLQPGHVVLFRHEDAVKIGEWQGSLIIFYPANPGDPSFAPVRTTDADVYGRVRRLIREL